MIELLSKIRKLKKELKMLSALERKSMPSAKRINRLFAIGMEISTLNAKVVRCVERQFNKSKK